MRPSAASSRTLSWPAFPPTAPPGHGPACPASAAPSSRRRASRRCSATRAGRRSIPGRCIPTRWLASAASPPSPSRCCTGSARGKASASTCRCRRRTSLSSATPGSNTNSPGRCEVRSATGIRSTPRTACIRRDQQAMGAISGSRSRRKATPSSRRWRMFSAWATCANGARRRAASPMKRKWIGASLRARLCTISKSWGRRSAILILAFSPLDWTGLPVDLAPDWVRNAGCNA